jgi:cell division septum initiation protein DivIVA
MAPEVTPEALRQAQFRTTLRGWDRAEVEEMLEATAVKLEQLEAARLKLKADLDQAPERGLETEFDNVGREVSAILQSAREAAQSMRERASLDATRWRSEAMEEADSVLKAAAADAEAMRRDAWVTGSELLEQTVTTAESMRANAERDVLTIQGEAEREAHRLTSGARREAEDMLRNASMGSEKITSDATKRRDEIIDGANRQASAAQERTRALEQRRDELLDELENVRSTLTRLEGSLEERREALDLTASEPSSVRVVHPPAEAKQDWALGETVRVVPPDGREPVVTDEAMAGDVSDEVASLQEPAPAVPETEPEPVPEPATPEPEPETETVGTAAVETEPDSDHLSALFQSLRGGGEPPAEGAENEPMEDVTDTTDDGADEDEGEEDGGNGAEPDEGIDWIEVRESRLLPITNRALRGVKKAMTEVQNVALDSLRTDDGWRPDQGAIAMAVHAELVAVWSESFAAGHGVAEQMTGSKLRRPATPSSKADREFAADLADAVSGALDKAGEGPRELQSAASRVFRVWRTDEAERRIRDVALLAYETGIEKSRTVSSNV